MEWDETRGSLEDIDDINMFHVAAHSRLDLDEKQQIAIIYGSSFKFSDCWTMINHRGSHQVHAISFGRAWD